MESLLNLLVRFELFNNLFPGIIFVYFLKLYDYLPSTENLQLYESLFIAYFLGLVFNRIGSIFLEPFFQKIKFFKISDYPNFLEGKKNDNRINTTILINNMYRSFIIVFYFHFFLIFFKIFSNKNFYFYLKEIIVLLFLIYIFGFSYRKQTYFIKEKLKKIEEEKGEEINSRVLITSSTYLYKNSIPKKE